MAAMLVAARLPPPSPSWGPAGNLPGVNLANAVTFGRILLVPVFLFVAYHQGTDSAVAAFVLFLLASVSDSLDGYLARSRNMITRLGQFLDPTADKLLVGSALWVLVDTRGFPLWAALAIAVRELAVQILRTRIVGRGGDLPASTAGKAKTTLQIVMVCWWLLPWETITPLHWAWLAAAVATTVISGVEYFRRATWVEETA